MVGSKYICLCVCVYVYMCVRVSVCMYVFPVVSKTCRYQGW